MRAEYFCALTITESRTKTVAYRIWIFCGYFLGSSQNWASFRGFFLRVLGYFLKVNLQNGSIFGGR